MKHGASVIRSNMSIWCFASSHLIHYERKRRTSILKVPFSPTIACIACTKLSTFLMYLVGNTCVVPSDVDSPVTLAAEVLRSDVVDVEISLVVFDGCGMFSAPF